MPDQFFEATLRHPVMHLAGAVIIDLQGEINGSVETTLNSAYEQAEAEDTENIILNFSAVNYINSTGIALIVGLLAVYTLRRLPSTIQWLKQELRDQQAVCSCAGYFDWN